ncbi:hypothetical protein ACFQY7_28415 [Actinomadura luteofluorescens]|uniref:hypothetical protein n=1 Tax=Actinomadura luteofluorescens TaxID=46163 RepID=UPI003385D20D
MSGCDMGRNDSCTVTVTAVGGYVNWQVTGTSGPVRAGGSGHLDAGRSGGVQVSRASGFCWGSQTGTVSFSSGASATVTYRC